MLALGFHFDARPRLQFLDAIPDTLRVLGALVLLFGLAGFGLVRLLLPSALSRYELLWVVPAGGCAVGLALTVLGFAGVPYAVSLPVLVVGALALDVHAVRRRGWPSLEARRLAWPAYIALLVLAIALIPMVAAQHYAAPIGTGSDAHEAAGVAQFLKHAYPTSVDIHQPINQMPGTWKSKYPIYYAEAGVSTVSGLGTWQVLAPMIDTMLALASIGLFLLAIEVFSAPFGIALAAMGLAGLDRMALHTAIHPYFNQTWGFFAMPFTVVLGWELVQPGRTRRTRGATAGLLAIFFAILLLAYPLAAPIPAVPLVVFALSAWRRRVKAGESVLRLSDLYRGWRSLLWMIPLAAAFAVPVVGVVVKVNGAINVLLPGHSLQAWSGDVLSFYPFDHFFSLPSGPQGALLAVMVAALALAGVWGRDRALTWGLGGLLLLGVALALYFRQRAFGYYFYFKLLAFIGPLVLLIAAVGAGRWRRLGPILLVILAVCTFYSDEQEIRYNGSQLPQSIIQLSAWAKSLPRGATIRLDMPGPLQIWVAYFMDSRPLCSVTPLLNTDYPHVPVSFKADYILADYTYGRSNDTIGPPLKVNAGFRLFRENPNADVPGPENCHYRRLDRIYTGLGYSPS